MPKFRGSNDWPVASYDWMGEHREAFSAATQNASRLAIGKYAARG